MVPLFDRLFVWLDPVPRPGPAQMACDEILLERADVAVLRIFRWSEPCVSAGYFVPWNEARGTRPDLPVCRRWTGGGVVVHGNDLTFALVAPREEPWARLRAGESYRALHAAAACALQAAGVAAALYEGTTAGGGECFAAPVGHDVMVGARKIAGGAQRRTKRGLLHQGSIQQPGLGTDFAMALADSLAAERGFWSPPRDFEEAASDLARRKYARESFLRGETGAQTSLQEGHQPKFSSAPAR